MPTVHELLVQKVASGQAAAPAAAQASKKEPVMIDDAGLDKLASTLEAIAAGKWTVEAANQVLLKTAQIIRQVKVERAYLINDKAETMHKEAASKVAGDLVKKGIYSDGELSALTEKVAKINNLDAFKQAVELVQPAKKGLPIGTVEKDRKSTRLNSSHIQKSRMPSSA